VTHEQTIDFPLRSITPRPLLSFGPETIVGVAKGASFFQIDPSPFTNNDDFYIYLLDQQYPHNFERAHEDFHQLIIKDRSMLQR
jgi:hypothetical protein